MTEILNCDLCGIEIKDYEDVNHFTGTVDGKFSNHIHVCSACLVSYDLERNFIDVISVK